MRLRTSGKAKRYFIFIGSGIIGLLLWFFYILDGLRIFIPLYPFLSGFPVQTKNYLVVLQNEAEIRPGGGFITAYGVLKFVSGIPVSFHITDSFDLSGQDKEFITPPEPMGTMLKGNFYGGWAFQDSNIFLDFSQNAEKIKWFYQRVYPKDDIDGVIAVNFSLLEKMAQVVGPIKVKNKVIAPNDLFAELEYEVSNVDRHNVEDLKERKEILDMLYSKIVSKIVLSPLKYKQITDIVTREFDQKNIQFWTQEYFSHKALARKKWDGDIPSKSTGDTLGVIFSNFGGMKSDRYVEKNVSYHVTLDPFVANGDTPTLRSKVDIDLSHFGGYNEPLSYTYKGFVQIMIPKESIVLHKDADMFFGTEGEYMTVGKKVTMEPQTSTSLQFEYLLPSDILQNNAYELHLYKQSGVSPHYNISFFTPTDFTLSGNQWDIRDNVGLYFTKLLQDENLHLSISKDTRPPRITFQIFQNLETMEIHFNEEIDPSFCDEKDAFSIQDKNVKDPHTDTIRIVDIKCVGSGVLLSLEGVTDQKEEHYQVVVKDQRDRFGNIIFPNPREITVVQRLPES